MDDNNKVTVKIYGQEYTISGDKARDHIIKVADHVDDVMKEISYSIQEIPALKLAVLAAINITDDYFSEKDGFTEMAAEKDQLEKDKDHYVQLWEEAKKSFLQYKEDAQTALEQKEEAQNLLHEKNQEIKNESDEIKRNEDTIASLEQKIENLTNRLKATEEGKTSSSEAVREWEDKYKEIEGNYFELQMENIRLKGDLERYKKIVD